MAMLRKKSRVGGEIPTSSMADIAFLLLIFFLVTTVFDEEQGIRIVLPEPAEEQEVSQRNILHLTINPGGLVTVKFGESPSETQVRYPEVRTLWRTGVAENPNLIAAVKTHPDARYEHMINVLDELEAAGATRISLQMLEQ